MSSSSPANHPLVLLVVVLLLLPLLITLLPFGAVSTRFKWHPIIKVVQYSTACHVITIIIWFPAYVSLRIHSCRYFGGARLYIGSLANYK